MSNLKQLDRGAYGLEDAKIIEISFSQSLKVEAVNKATTLQVLYNEYVEVMKHEIRESSQNLKIHVLSELGEIRLSKLTLSMLRKWKLKTSHKNWLSQQSRKYMHVFEHC